MLIAFHVPTAGTRSEIVAAVRPEEKSKALSPIAMHSVWLGQVAASAQLAAAMPNLLISEHWIGMADNPLRQGSEGTGLGD